MPCQIAGARAKGMAPTLRLLLVLPMLALATGLAAMIGAGQDDHVPEYPVAAV
jgi:hypothetical protein